MSFALFDHPTNQSFYFSDWEYPGVQGAGGNVVSANDTVNFLTFLQTLRSALGPQALLTAAVSTSPFHLPSTMLTADSQKVFAGFGKVLDYILIMNYDTYGGGATAGPNAPLDASSSIPACTQLSSQNSDDEPSTSAKGSIDAWTKSGFPAERILLGVPSYGYVYETSATTLAEPTKKRRSMSWTENSKKAAAERKAKKQMARTFMPSPVAASGPDDPSTSSTPSDASPPPAAQAFAAQVASVKLTADSSAQIQFLELIQAGALQTTTASASASASANSSSGPPSSFVGGGGFVRQWDGCSSTPFLTSSSSKQLVSYDDPASLLLKAQFAKQRGIGGVNMFDVHGDTASWDLVDALRSGLGLKVPQ